MENDKPVNPISGTTRAVEVEEVGRIVFDKFQDGIRFIVLRGPASWCAYVGIPKDHPLAGFDYDDLMGVSAHGGLTYAGNGIEGVPEGYYWYGWDYAHSWDVSIYDHEYNKTRDAKSKDWTVDEVVQDSQETIWDFKRMTTLAEKIVNNYLTPTK